MAIAMTQIQPVPKKGRLQKLKELIKPPDPTERIREAGIIAKESGFIPWFKIHDVEQRRSEIITVMQELNSLEFSIIQSTQGITITQQKQFLFNAYKLSKLFQLFFITGSPWIRGADNETLSDATSAFIENFEDFGDIPSAFRDLHAEATYLLHLSWQGIDVTQTPPYITQIMNVPQKSQAIPLGQETPPTGTQG
jgi:hypothetical protein